MEVANLAEVNGSAAAADELERMLRAAILPSSVGSAVVELSPALAHFLLGRNKINRRRRGTRINTYANDMAGGRWALTGEPIIIDSEGNLIGGQHRLYACIESGASFRTLVVWGVDPSVRKSLDSGLAQTLGDVADESNSWGAAVRLCWRYDNHQFPQNSKFVPSRAQLMHWGEANPDLRVSMDAAAHQRVLPPGTLAAAHYLLSRSDAEAADAFLDGWTTLANLPAGSPVIVLRTWAENHKKGVHSDERFAVVVKAMKAFREGRSIQVLRWRRNGPAKESFPRFEES